jgi:hypothetical protein
MRTFERGQRCNEPEAARTPLRNMPMRQGEIGDRRPADSDRFLLLRKLRGSRKALRATGLRATGAQARRWDGLFALYGHSGKSMLRLVAAWIAMGFRRPEITLGKTVSKSP